MPPQPKEPDVVPVAIVSLPDDKPTPPAPGESLPATTTVQDDLVTQGQRRINMVWEFTQAIVTILITGAAIYCAVNKVDADVLNFAFVAVISTYYARTNHTKIGGVKYEGR